MRFFAILNPQTSINVRQKTNLNIRLTTSKKRNDTCTLYNIPQTTRKYTGIPGNTQEYQEIPRNTQKYQRVKKIPKNNRSYISTLLPNPKPRIFSNTRPDPILKNPTRWAPSMIRCRIEVVSLLLLVLLCLKSMLEISSGYICDCNL